MNKKIKYALYVLLFLYKKDASAILTMDSVAKKIQKYHDIVIYNNQTMYNAIEEVDRWIEKEKITRVNLFCFNESERCQGLKRYLDYHHISFRQIKSQTKDTEKIRIVYYELAKEEHTNKKEMGYAVSHNMLNSINDLRPLTKSARVQHHHKK